MNILVIAATPLELSPLFNTGRFSATDNNTIGENTVRFLFTGVGMIATAYRLTREISMSDKPGIILHAGIAGTFTDDISIGEIVQVATDRFADLGAEDKNGDLIDLFDLGFAGPDDPPFEAGFLKNATFRREDIRSVNAISVNTTSGTLQTIDRLKRKYNPDIETMEGAAVSYISRLHDIPGYHLRAISNKVEPRNREAWNIPLAVKNLNDFLMDILNKDNLFKPWIL